MLRLNLYSFLNIFALLVFLSGCSSSKDELKSFKDKSASRIYNSAMDAFEKGDYKKAAEIFSEVEAEHPYSDLAEKAEIMSAFSNYAAGKSDSALMTIDSYIQLYPGSKFIEYAYYLKGLVNEDMLSNSYRDQTATKDAIDSYRELINRFPKSKYAKAAKKKIVKLRERLAESHMYTARFMMIKREYSAAAIGFLNVLMDYKDTAQLPEAHYRLVECYLGMGMDERASIHNDILLKKFPQSKWYKKSSTLIAHLSKNKRSAHKMAKLGKKVKPFVYRAKKPKVKKV